MLRSSKWFHSFMSPTKALCTFPFSPKHTITPNPKICQPEQTNRMDAEYWFIFKQCILTFLKVASFVDDTSIPRSLSRLPSPSIGNMATPGQNNSEKWCSRTRRLRNAGSWKSRTKSYSKGVLTGRRLADTGLFVLQASVWAEPHATCVIFFDCNNEYTFYL